MPPSLRHRPFLSDGPGVARHFLPLPRAHRRFSEDNVYKFFHDGAVQTPKIPKTHFHSSLFIFDSSVFPDSPKQKAQYGLRTTSCEWVF